MRFLFCHFLGLLLATTVLAGEMSFEARVDRTLLGRIRALNRDEMRKNLGKWLTNDEVDAVLARRDVLVGILDKHIAAKGEGAVLYDLPRVNEPCGAGLGS